MTTTETAALYRRLAETLTRTVESVPADHWDADSPCEGWTARDVLRHVVETQSYPLGNVGLTLPPAPDVDVDPVGAWTQTRDAVLEILDDPARAGLEYDSQMGRTSVAATFGTFFCFDLVVHRWDLAHATGLDETIPAGDLALVAGFVEQAGEMLRSPGVCGPAVETPADADEQTRLLGALGRRA
ncbi:TIGR03086 family metal-binding protein [Rhodococcus tukisamuensis]|uniref:TIGR03086 family protein n=1 Tax=Rhodococcus tukisamuensis TaxID=168276 RepID=A0A1G6MRV5_9NOCA|nr:TIGR03086 family metal-binding protein [Rhodococcus tukisamuensis]SDC58293.1 TIGR03086 family protein [Rhodococcus tukisamuensis]